MGLHRAPSFLPGTSIIPLAEQVPPKEKRHPEVLADSASEGNRGRSEKAKHGPAAKEKNPRRRGSWLSQINATRTGCLHAFSVQTHVPPVDSHNHEPPAWACCVLMPSSAHLDCVVKFTWLTAAEASSCRMPKLEPQYLTSADLARRTNLRPCGDLPHPHLATFAGVKKAGTKCAKSAGRREAHRRQRNCFSREVGNAFLGGAPWAVAWCSHSVRTLFARNVPRGIRNATRDLVHRLAAAHATWASVTTTGAARKRPCRRVTVGSSEVRFPSSGHFLPAESEGREPT